MKGKSIQDERSSSVMGQLWVSKFQNFIIDYLMDYPLKVKIRPFINFLFMRLIYYVQCTECTSNNIWYDDKMGELFCQDCGLVLEEKFKIISIPDIIDYEKLLEKRERSRMMNEMGFSWRHIPILQYLNNSSRINSHNISRGENQNGI